MTPHWLHVLSMVALAAGFLCAGVIAVDVARHPQRMAIMNLVWPVTALFGTVLALWGYRRWGRLATRERAQAMSKQQASHGDTPFAVMVGKAASHCGSGCCLGDICAEWLAFAWPTVLVAFGWHTLVQEKTFAVWALDFVFAFCFGIVFQYFTIVPMRHLGFWSGIWAAVKADTLSLTAWQLGMYGFMAIANFWLFRHVLGTRLEVDSPEFWFMMQLAMLCGFATAYPVNWWLIKAGFKEKM